MCGFNWVSYFMETSQLQNCVFSTLAQYRQRFAHICGGMAASSSPSPADGQMGNRCVPAHLTLQLQNRNKTHRTIATTWIPYLIFCFDLTLQKTFKYNFTALKKKPRLSNLSAFIPRAAVCGSQWPLLQTAGTLSQIMPHLCALWYSRQA